MTKFEKLVKFAKNLPLEAQNALADDLLALMKTRNHDMRLTAEEITEVEQALAQPHPSYASQTEVEAAIGARFS